MRDSLGFPLLKIRQLVISRLAFTAICVGLGSGCADDAVTLETHLASAREAVASGRDIDALIELKSAAQLVPTSVSARFELAQLHFRMGDPAVAVKEAEKAKSLGLEREIVEPVLIRAYIQARDANAALSLAKSLEEDLPSPENSLLLAEAHFAVGDMPEAENVYGQLFDENPDNVNALIGLARVYGANGDTNKQHKYVEAALQRDPNNVDALVIQGAIAYANREEDLGLSYFEQAAARDSYNMGAQIGWIQALTYLDKHELAHQQIAKARRQFPRNIALEYWAGVNFYREEKYDEAEDSFRRILSVIPGHAESQFFMGALMYKAGNNETAADHLSSSIQESGHNLNALNLLAAVQLRLKRANDSLATLEIIEKLKPLNARLQAIKGHALLMTGDVDRALEALSTAAELDPEEQSYKTDLAFARIGLGLVDDAVSAIESDANFGNRETAATFVAYGHLRAKNWDKAVAVCEQYLQEHGDNEFILNTLGIAYMRKEDRESARKAFEKAIATKADFISPLRNLVAIDFEDGAYKTIPKDFEKLKELAPDNALVLTILAQQAMTSNDMNTAIELLERARALYPHVVGPRLQLAKIYFARGESSRSFEAAKEAVTIAPKDEPALRAIIKPLIQSKNFEKADVFSRRAAELYEDSPSANYFAGLVKIGLEDFATAISYFRQVLKVSPEHPPTLFALSKLLIDSGEHKEALATIKQLQSVEGETSRVNFVLGNLDASQGDLERALVKYKKSYQASPSREGMFKLISTSSRLGQTDEALKHAQDWLADDSGDNMIRLIYAQSLEVAERLESAVVQYKLILESEPNSVVVLNNLALLGLRTNDVDALSIAERAHTLAPDQPAVLDTYGWVLVQQGSLEKGVTTLEKAVNAAPDLGDIRYHYAIALLKVGQREAARKELSKAIESTFNGDMEAAKKLLASLDN